MWLIPGCFGGEWGFGAEAFLPLGGGVSALHGSCPGELRQPANTRRRHLITLHLLPVQHNHCQFRVGVANLKNLSLFSPADCREAESDSGRSLPPTENCVITGEHLTNIYCINKHCSTTAAGPLTVSLWCLLFSARQQSSTTRCPSLSARCLIQERWSSYWACSDNPL